MRGAVSVFCSALLLLLLACEGDLLAGTDCGVLEATGCIDKGQAVDQCSDPSCSALYTCVASEDDPLRGTWQQSRECPARAPIADAGADAEAARDADTAPRDASFPDDLPEGAAGGPGCLSLQLPDCSLATGYGCPSACCGCEDLFVCEAGEWFLWGSCQDDVPTPAP